MNFYRIVFVDLVGIHIEIEEKIYRKQNVTNFSVTFERIYLTVILKTNPISLHPIWKHLCSLFLFLWTPLSPRLKPLHKLVSLFFKNVFNKVYQKGDSGTGAFLWIFTKFLTAPFWQNTSGGFFCSHHLEKIITKYALLIKRNSRGMNLSGTSVWRWFWPKV